MDASIKPAETQQVLSQSEVEMLLAHVAEEQSGAVVDKVSGEQERPPKEAAQPYDFRHPAFLSPGELRKLRLRHEDFIRSLAARLSLYLRLEFGVQLSKLETLPYHKFCEGLHNPTHITLFKLEPLRGICLVDLQPRLGLTIVDRLMGGPALSANADREITEIELALLDQVVQMVMGEWCNHWGKVQELRPVLLGHESNGRFLQTAPADTAMLVLSMEARVGDCMEQMQIAIPSYSLEPLIQQINRSVETEVRENPKPEPTPTRWNARLDDVEVRVDCAWEGVELTARDLANLQVGQVLRLDPQVTHAALVRIGGLPKFSGQLGTQGTNLAVQLTQLLKS